MTYYQFVQEIEGKVKEGVKEHVTVSVHTATKNNGIKREGLTLMKQGVNISPTIYLEEYYQKFQQGRTVEDIAADILHLYGEVRFQHSYEASFILDYTKVEDRIIYHVINQDRNKELLEEVPYIPYLDLAIVFYVLLEINPYGTATMLIREEHRKMWDVKTEDLYDRASENTQRLLPCEFMEMQTVIEELTPGMIQEQEENTKEDMYVLSNKIKCYGAATILYNGRLKGIEEYLKENFYVLPSSVHEVIIIPESEAPGRRALSKLVEEINETQVGQEDILSNTAYYYDRTIEKLL